MTRHTRSIEKSREAALRRQTEGPFRLPRWVDLLGIDPNYLNGQPIDAYLAEARGETDPIDTDHAIALERERIAAWMESPQLSDSVWADPESIGTDKALAHAIRQGAHHKEGQ